MEPLCIKVGARSSALSRAQVQEVLLELRHHHFPIVFDVVHLEAMGDRDRLTSLRSLGKTDFFTKEIDDLLLQGACRLAIHSAKDLPDPLPKGLTIAAITQGVDASDVLVLRPGVVFTDLPPGACIATSSERREECVKKLRNDFVFRDLRGTVPERLALIDKGEVDGVVVAEAALIRLKLTHLNRIRLPGETTPFQGQLAILCREEDVEMLNLLRCIDTRQKKRKVLYLGLDLPENPNQDQIFMHYPLIRINFRSSEEPDIQEGFKDLYRYTHLIFTSKSAVHAFFKNLTAFNCKNKDLDGKTILCVGKYTAKALRAYGITSLLVAPVETSEGVVELIKTLDLSAPYFFWPHSALSRPVLSQFMHKKDYAFRECILYDTVPNRHLKPLDLDAIDEIHFTSPSTIDAFEKLFGHLPKNKVLKAIGPITEERLLNSPR